MSTTEEQSKYHEEEEYLHPSENGHQACPGCAMVLALRYFLRGLGEKVLFVTTAGCTMPVVLAPKLITEYRGKSIPWLSVPFGSTAICAGGVKAGLTAKGDTETEVVVWAGDGAAFDIGFGGLSAAAERNEDIIYVCYDNEGYQNTGNQRSSATPWGAVTTTNPIPVPKGENKKDIMMLMAMHHIPYAATATVAYPDDLMEKAKKAKMIQGFRFLHILTPCPTGWQFPPAWTVKISRLAVDTKVFPLYEVEGGYKWKINEVPQGLPVDAYVRIQGRYKHLGSEQTALLQHFIDERWNRLKWFDSYKR